MPRRSSARASRPHVPARPVHQPPPQTKQPAAQPPQSGGPGLFGQMAATAGGVAVGSAVGHAVGSALFGGSEGRAVEPAVYEQVPTQNYGKSLQKPCEIELEQFLECAKNSGDLSLCEGFNQVLKECRVRYNL